MRAKYYNALCAGLWDNYWKNGLRGKLGEHTKRRKEKRRVRGPLRTGTHTVRLRWWRQNVGRNNTNNNNTVSQEERAVVCDVNSSEPDRRRRRLRC